MGHPELVAPRSGNHVIEPSRVPVGQARIGFARHGGERTRPQQAQRRGIDGAHPGAEQVRHEERPSVPRPGQRPGLPGRAYTARHRAGEGVDPHDDVVHRTGHEDTSLVGSDEHPDGLRPHPHPRDDTLGSEIDHGDVSRALAGDVEKVGPGRERESTRPDPRGIAPRSIRDGRRGAQGDLTEYAPRRRVDHGDTVGVGVDDVHPAAIGRDRDGIGVACHRPCTAPRTQERRRRRLRRTRPAHESEDSPKTHRHGVRGVKRMRAARVAGRFTAPISGTQSRSRSTAIIPSTTPVSPVRARSPS